MILIKIIAKSKCCHPSSLEQILDSVTSNYVTILDHIYTNIDKSMINSCGVLESYFSDHKPVFISLHLINIEFPELHSDKEFPEYAMVQLNLYLSSVIHINFTKY